MRIALTGGTGFIGKPLAARLLAEGHQVELIGRGAPLNDALESADAIVHLAGEPVAQRWTKEVKQRIRSSRVEGTRKLVAAVALLSCKPTILVCASAIGYYGDRGDETLTEESPPGRGFLAEVCVDWEQAADSAVRLGLRVVKVRTGIVLGKHGGALRKMLTPFRAGAGGTLGSGRQWMSWIHIDDIVGLYILALTNDAVRGPVNGTAPHPATNADFTRTLACVLRRPAILPVPALALRLLYGEMAEVILASQKLEPHAAEAAGYRYHFADLEPALRHIIGDN